MICFWCATFRILIESFRCAQRSTCVCACVWVMCFVDDIGMVWHGVVWRADDDANQYYTSSNFYICHFISHTNRLHVSNNAFKHRISTMRCACLACIWHPSLCVFLFHMIKETMRVLLIESLCCTAVACDFLFSAQTQTMCFINRFKLTSLQAKINQFTLETCSRIVYIFFVAHRPSILLLFSCFFFFERRKCDYSVYEYEKVCSSVSLSLSGMFVCLLLYFVSFPTNTVIHSRLNSQFTVGFILCPLNLICKTNFMFAWIFSAKIM